MKLLSSRKGGGAFWWHITAAFVFHSTSGTLCIQGADWINSDHASTELHSEYKGGGIQMAI